MDDVSTIMNSKCSTQFRIGWESEFNVTDVLGRPVDMRPLFANGGIVCGEHSKIVLDAGRDQLETVGDPTYQPGIAAEQMMDLYHQSRQLNDGLTLHFHPRRKYGTPASRQDFFKPRLQAMYRAVQDRSEGGQYGASVVESGNSNAFHLHLEVGDTSTFEAVQIENLLCLAAPTIVAWFHERCQIPVTYRNQIWTRFAREERLPAPRWFADFSARKRFFESVPCLIQCEGDEDKHAGAWSVDLSNLQQWGDPVADSTMWWVSRLRYKYSTCEFRGLPTTYSPSFMQLASYAISGWLEQALEVAVREQFETFTDAAVPGRLPLFEGYILPRSEAKWWQEWRKF